MCHRNSHSSQTVLAFHVIAGPGSAVDVLLIQTHTNQTWVLIGHPALHVLQKCMYYIRKDARGQSKRTVMPSTATKGLNTSNLANLHSVT